MGIGQAVTIRTHGGGEYGPAQEHPEEKVADDVLNGYVTPPAAKQDCQADI